MPIEKRTRPAYLGRRVRGMLMVGMFGAKTDELRALAAEFTGEGEILQGVPGITDPEIERREMWIGPDAEAFRADWSAGPSTQLTELGTILGQIARELQAQADEQDECSSPGGGAGLTSMSAFGDIAGSGIGHGAGRSIGDVMKMGLPEGPGMTGGPGITLDDVLADDSPNDRRDLWTQLPEAERERILAEEPERVANVDGIPFEDRARANQAVAEDILADGGRGLSEDRLKVVEKVASGELKVVLFDPAKGDIVQMVGTPSENTDKVIIFAPPTGGRFEDFNTRHYFGHVDHLHSMHPDSVAFIYQRGDWAQKVAPPFGEADRYANDPTVAINNGKQIASFHHDALGSDPRLANASKAGIGFSYGHSALTASEMFGAKYDHIVSLAGSNMPEGWTPNPDTKYANVQHSNDMLNVAQKPWPLSEVLYGSSPDQSKTYDQYDAGKFKGDKPMVDFKVEYGEKDFGWIKVPTIENADVDFEFRNHDGAEAHAHITKTDDSNAFARDSIEEFLYKKK